ncbi:centrosomal protein of 19 kDa [Bufo gargarizans]|uniref:centrosomal protein of 19 kDa n=1 Tax=Bufo gargarizans TaxID=30331 RepID=UPI001CF25CDA|nr:centrosomal protein of 19 kDa [Bufo gargarizans]
MSYKAKKCGIRFEPPAIILVYEKTEGKSRQRIMPIRNFSKFSDCTRAAEQLKNNPRHRQYLEGVSLKQLERLYKLVKAHLKGESLEVSLELIQKEESIDPDEDLNKLDDKELAKRKNIMDELFEKNRKKKDDPDFEYNVEVDFPQEGVVETCGWDDDSEQGF